MRLIIAGSRHLEMSPIRFSLILGGVGPSNIKEVVAGGCGSGPDFLAKTVAQASSTIRYVEFPADWDKHGKAAGPIRNRQMAEYADALLLIWDGKSRGSANMLSEAKKAGLAICVLCS